MSTTETPARKAVITYPSDTELLITRDFDAPRNLVLDALTKPEHVRQWYGLEGDSLKVCEIDFRVGGRWHYVMPGGPGEEDISFSGEYLEINAPDGFVSTESYDNMPGASYVVTISLTETGGRTRLQSHLKYPAQEWRDGHVESGMEFGLNISYDRLEALLARLA